MLKITLKKSTIGAVPKNLRTVKALGLNKTGRFVYQEDTPVIRGMIHQVKHLLEVEEVEGVTKVRRRRRFGKLEGAAPAAEAKPAAKKETAKKAPAKKEAAPAEAEAEAKPKRTRAKKSEEEAK
ncbi:50S ribosomal protein L30 [Armatimonadetes bacterium Uphvl-Ar2]|jgi:large subunit ribosomal protein L30|nr:50S ribosomal protein L30 [Armatimonadetes bacterium Uphvl-Ar2]